MRRRLCPTVMSSSSILDMSGCYSSHPPDDCLGFIKLETMFKGIHIFCDGAFIAPLSHLYPSYFKLHAYWLSSSNSNYLGHIKVKDKVKLSVFTANDNKSRSDDDSDDNGQATLIKSTLLNAKCFFFYFNQPDKLRTCPHKLGHRHCNPG